MARPRPLTLTPSRKKILRYLRSSGVGWTSGARMAAGLGVSRNAVWKHVRILQEEGVPIEGSARQGYRLRAPFDLSLLDLDEVLTRRIRFVVHPVVTVPSTQGLAKQAASEGFREGHLWVAEQQTQGQGRLGREWASPLGGLWFSVLLRPAISPGKLAALALVAAIALAETIRKKTGLPATLKWPNDVGIRQGGVWKKVAGFLTETSAEMDRVHWVVLGVGVNVNNRLPTGLQGQAVSLAELSGRVYSRAILLKDFLKRLSRFYRRFQREGFAPFRRRYARLHDRQGKRITLQTAQGILTGTVAGVDAQGALVVKSRGRLSRVLEGEITA